MEPNQMPIDKVLPPVFFTADQASEIADLEKTILDHVKEMMARFVTGDSDIDKKNWDSYVKKNLDNMNLKRYLEVYQQAYDAKNKKKNSLWIKHLLQGSLLGCLKRCFSFIPKKKFLACKACIHCRTRRWACLAVS